MIWLFLVIGIVFIAVLWQRVNVLSTRLHRIETRLAKEQPVAAPAAEPVRVEKTVEVPASVPPQPQAQQQPQPPSPPKPAPPRKPNPIMEWIAGGNTIVRVGLLILFVGLAFLIKYGVEHQLVPVELRVAAVAAVGLVLLVLGWRLRLARPGYALSLQGAGVAILYLTIFGSLRLYHLIPAGPAFAMLAAIAVLSAFLAVAQDSLALAVFAAAGGFLAPVLASTGAGNHVMLFSYYLLINAGIVAIAWFRAWRVLNLVGFAFTFLIGAAWGWRSYRPELFDTTEPFLVAFFLIYVAIAVLFARKQASLLRDYVDGTIVFGTPLAAFGLQAGLMRGTEFGLAYSSLAAAALYLALATVLKRVGRERWTLLAEAFLALGVVFATVAIPLALDARWTSAAWALEGAAIVWIGIRQHRTLARVFGLLLQLAAGLAFMKGYPGMPPGPPLMNAVFIGAVLVALGGLVTQRLLARAGDAITGEEKGVAPLYFLWGLGWWLFAGGHEIHAVVDDAYELNALVVFLPATALAFAGLASRLDWREATWPLYGLAPVLFVLALASLVFEAHPFAHYGWIAWPFAVATQLALLRGREPDEPARSWQLLHVLVVFIVALLGAVELEWFAADNTARDSAWSLAARIVVPSLVVLAISSRWADTRWPVAANTAAYRLGAVLPILVAMGLWSLHVNASHAGGSDPLPYIPLLNALDLAHILAIFAVVAAWMALRRSLLEAPAVLRGRNAIGVAGIVGFVWLNAILLRTLHHTTGVEYDFDSLSRSVLVQASLSVFWAFLALASMVIATRTARRALWMIGAALMGVVVAKLVLVDLSHLSGIERIVSFIGVGVLMLVIGYFSPVPPRRTEGAVT